MKHTFNDITFHIEGCSWWTAPVTNTTEWIVGCRYLKEDGSTAILTKQFDSQEIAEAILRDHLGFIERIRENREGELNRIFRSLQITTISERKRYKNYLNYWLDKELEASVIVKRFAKDHPKWVAPRPVAERADSNRNPYVNAQLERELQRAVERNNQSLVPPPWSITPTEPIVFGLDAAFVAEMANTNLAESDLVTQDGNNQFTLRDAQLEQSPTIAHDNELIRAQVGYIRDGMWFESNPATLADMQSDEDE